MEDKSHLYVNVSIGLFVQLVEAQNEADMLKRLLKERRYLGIDGKEVALLCKTMGLEDEE